MSTIELPEAEAVRYLASEFSDVIDEMIAARIVRVAGYYGTKGEIISNGTVTVAITARPDNAGGMWFGITKTPDR